jgi:hypothetical protein
MDSTDKFQFDFTSISPQGFALPGLGGGSGIVQSLQSKVPSVTTAALSIASEAQTVISSAITAIVVPETGFLSKHSFSKVSPTF